MERFQYYEDSSGKSILYVVKEPGKTLADFKGPALPSATDHTTGTKWDSNYKDVNMIEKPKLKEQKKNCCAHNNDTKYHSCKTNQT